MVTFEQFKDSVTYLRDSMRDLVVGRGFEDIHVSVGVFEIIFVDVLV